MAKSKAKAVTNGAMVVFMMENGMTTKLMAMENTVGLMVEALKVTKIMN